MSFINHSCCCRCTYLFFVQLSVSWYQLDHVCNTKPTTHWLFSPNYSTVFFQSLQPIAIIRKLGCKDILPNGGHVMSHPSRSRDPNVTKGHMTFTVSSARAFFIKLLFQQKILIQVLWKVWFLFIAIWTICRKKARAKLIPLCELCVHLM